MPQEAPRPLASGAPLRIVALRSQPLGRAFLAPLVALLALVALAGCAPLHSRPTSERSAARAGGAQSGDAPRATGPERIDGEPAPPSSAGQPAPERIDPQILLVKASAYNSRRGQTDATPDHGAWGDRLQPGMKVIAVSKDLLALGLTRGQRVRIRGLDGEYVVLDRMPSRWRQKIDIYMGEDVGAARRWGVREVEIEWVPEAASDGGSGVAGATGGNGG